jgi:hypothetical protein
LGRLFSTSREVPVEKTVGKTVSKAKIDPDTGATVLDENSNPVMEDVVETTIEIVMETVTSASSELSSTRRNVYVRDILSDAVLTKHPEIAQILPGFLSALEAVGRREGTL